LCEHHSGKVIKIASEYHTFWTTYIMSSTESGSVDGRVSTEVEGPKQSGSLTKVGISGQKSDHKSRGAEAEWEPHNDSN
jgi:hypothetical protein